jgi:hypothetical protein
MLVGYARVSTQEQDLALRLGALVAAGRGYERTGAAALVRLCPTPTVASGLWRRGDGAGRGSRGGVAPRPPRVALPLR